MTRTLIWRGIFEYVLRFDIIVSQIDEYEIDITKEFYALVEEYCTKMKVDARVVEFLKKRISDLD